MNEKQLQKLITDHLTYLRKIGRLFFLRVNSGTMMSNYTTAGGQNRRYAVRLAPKGTSDIILYLPNAVCVFLELKGEGKKQSPEQVSFERTIKGLGYHYYCIDNYDDFMAILDKHLI